MRVSQTPLICKSAEPDTTATDTIFEVPVSAVRPAQVNEAIYKPVSPSDPGIQDLAEQIRQFEQLEPAVITLDDVIISGHRRRVACMLAGVATLKVRRFPILSTDPGFESLLVAFNKQREKSADEVFREQLVLLSPTEAHRRLVEYRTEAARPKAPTITLDGTKKRAAISAAKWPFLDAIKEIVRELKPYWPLSDRQIHYALLNAPPLTHASKPGSRYQNDQASYKSLCELLTRARLVGEVPFEAIADQTRPVVNWSVSPGTQEFIREEVGEFLRGYFRDYQRPQPVHVEIVGEKNTIEGIIRPLASEFCIPYTIGRGYSSLPPRHGMAARFRATGKERLLILFLSDFDPEGDDIPHSFARSIRDDFNVPNVSAVKVALTRGQAEQMQLPSLARAKAGSSRRKAFVDRHQSDSVWELEAIPPDRLQEILRDAITSILDLDLLRAEQEKEQDDAVELDKLRQEMCQFFARRNGAPGPNSTMAQFGANTAGGVQ